METCDGAQFAARDRPSPGQMEKKAKKQEKDAGVWEKRARQAKAGKKWQRETWKNRRLPSSEWGVGDDRLWLLDERPQRAGWGWAGVPVFSPLSVLGNRRYIAQPAWGPSPVLCDFASNTEKKGPKARPVVGSLPSLISSLFYCFFFTGLAVSGCHGVVRGGRDLGPGAAFRGLMPKSRALEYGFLSSHHLQLLGWCGR